MTRINTFTEFLNEIGAVERDSNRRHMSRDSEGHAGPDPAVQRELRNTGVLYRAAKASQKPGLSRLKNKVRHLTK